MNGLSMCLQLGYPDSLNACLNWAAHFIQFTWAAHIKTPQKILENTYKTCACRIMDWLLVIA